MSLEQPLLRSRGPNRELGFVSRLNRAITGITGMSHARPRGSITDLIANRKKESTWEAYRQEQRNIEEVQVLELIITRLLRHTDKMGEEPQAHKVLVHLGHIITELAALDRDRLSFDALGFLVDEITAVEGLTPVPTSLNLRNFLRAIDAALDRKMFLEELETNAALNVVPVRADDPIPSDEEAEAADEASQDGEESAEDNETISAEDLLRQHDRAGLKEELKRLGQRVQGSTHELAERLAKALRHRRLKTLDNFRENWWEWKIKNNIPPEDATVLLKWSDSVSGTLMKRLETACEDFKRFPVCEWFMRSIVDSLEEGYFGVLNCDYDSREEQREWLPLVRLGGDAEDMIKWRFILPDALHAGGELEFTHGIDKIHSHVLPNFVLRLTQLKAVMVAQAHNTDQLRNKMLAMMMTAGIGLVQVCVHFLMIRFGFYNVGNSSTR